jgi:DNA-binding helix-hairpin-helix protein with protein kinase domain
MSVPSIRQLFYESGQSLQIHANPLARGGEGTVHTISSSDEYLVKIYSTEPDETRVAKLRAMIATESAALIEASAWPLSLIYQDAQRQSVPIGFMMPAVVDHRELHQLFSPVERKSHFPSANWRMLALTASNLARVVHAVHQAGAVIGDLNQNNVLVSSRATVRLIDCDSFQFRRSDGNYWTSDVGKEEYLPPELQSASLRDLVRSPNDDNFALAILIFQLLFMGRHPFSGRHTRATDFPIGMAITEGAYFYGRLAAQRGFSPPPFVITPAVLPIDISNAFESAFLSPSRPSALEWSELLLSFANSMATCTESARHMFYAQAGQCPWCLLKSSIRVDYFPEPIAQNMSQTATLNLLKIEVPLEDLCESISSVAPFQFKYKRPTVLKQQLRPVNPPPEGVERPFSLNLEREPLEPAGGMDHPLVVLIQAFLIPIVMMALGSLFFKPVLGFILISVSFGLFALCKAFQALLLHHSHKSWLLECDKIRSANHELQSDWQNLNQQWLTELQSRMQLRDIVLAKLVDRELQWTNWLDHIRNSDSELRQEARNLQNSITRKLQAYEKDLNDHTRARQIHAVEQWMEGHLIRDANIAQIGRSRVAMLASFGIETAADVIRLFQSQSFAIPGFGQRLMNNLWYWAADIQTKYKPDATVALPLELGLKIKSKYEQEIQTMAHRLYLIGEDLAGFMPLVESKQPKVMGVLTQLALEYLQAEADVKVMSVD